MCPVFVFVWPVQVEWGVPAEAGRSYCIWVETPALFMWNPLWWEQISQLATRISINLSKKKNIYQPTIVKCVEQCRWVDVWPPHQDVVYGPLGSFKAWGGQPRGNGKGLPPAQASGVSQSSLWQNYVVSPHWHILQIVHLMQESPGHAWAVTWSAWRENLDTRKCMSMLFASPPSTE